MKNFYAINSILKTGGGPDPVTPTQTPKTNATKKKGKK